jgi:hypothetical protein
MMFINILTYSTIVFYFYTERAMSEDHLLTFIMLGSIGTALDMFRGWLKG